MAPVKTLRKNSRDPEQSRLSVTFIFLNYNFNFNSIFINILIDSIYLLIRNRTFIIKLTFNSFFIRIFIDFNYLFIRNRTFSIKLAFNSIFVFILIIYLSGTALLLRDPEQFRHRKLKIIVIFYKYATFRMEWEADGSQFSRGSNMGPGTRTGIRTGDHNSGAEPTEGDGSTGGEGNSAQQGRLVTGTGSTRRPHQSRRPATSKPEKKTCIFLVPITNAAQLGTRSFRTRRLKLAPRAL